MNDATNAALLEPGRYWTDSPAFLAAFDPVDAALDREDSLSDRYAFMLGDQLGRCRMEGEQAWRSAEMERGYAHGRSLNPQAGDRYLRKLLGLRRGAFERGIPVSSALTAAYLRDIDVSCCPVSGTTLTHGTRTPDDWSIDRLDNTLGYVPGNVCVLSSRVNKLKGAMSVDDLREEVRSLEALPGSEALTEQLECGLLCIEARRLVALMAAPTGFAFGMLGMSPPFAMAPGAWTTLDGMVGTMHVASVSSAAAQANRSTLFETMGKAEWRLSNRLVARIRAELAAGTHPCDVWFDPVNERLLNETMGLLMRKPPVVPGLLAAHKAQEITEAILPMARYSRGG